MKLLPLASCYLIFLPLRRLQIDCTNGQVDSMCNTFTFIRKVRGLFVYVCTELLPPGGYPIAVKYIISYHIIYYILIATDTDDGSIANRNESVLDVEVGTPVPR
jgi:phosphatidylglycerophosphate synthase